LNALEWNVSMVDIVLKTKLNIPPAQAAWVSRPRLLKLLNTGMSRKLILVSAPAGFGKTTILSEWAGTLDPSPSWLSLDDDDNDPMRFWIHFIAALERPQRHVGKAALEMLQAFPRFPIQTCLAALINELCAGKSSHLLILDDYHAIRERSIHGSLKFFIDHMPPSMHLVISTRDRSPFSLGHIRIKDDLAEVGIEDLRFTRDETAKYARKLMGKNLTPEDIHSLDTCSEGWAAGLQLAALAMKKVPVGGIPEPGGGSRHMMEYFMEEFFSFHPEDVQNFLLDTSILDRLSGPLCEAVSGRKESARMLESLCAGNMLIFPLDHEHHWYRYHNLLSNALQSRLKKLDPDRISLLHARASRWFKENRLPNEAINHAILAKDWEFASSLVARYAVITFLRGESSTVLRWMQALPPKLISGNPGLCVVHAWALFFRNLENRGTVPLDMIEDYLNMAEGHYSSLQDRDTTHPPEKQVVLGHANALRIFLAYEKGEAPEAFIDLCQRSLANFSMDDSPKELSGIYILMGMAHLNMGEVEEASKALDKAASIGFARDVFYVVVIADSLRALVAKITGRLRKAESICRKSMAMIQESYVRQKKLPPEMLGFIQLILVDILLEKNDVAAAERVLEECSGAVRFMRNIYASIQYHAFLARIRLIRGADLPEIFTLISHIENLEYSYPGARTYAAALRIQCLLARCWNNHQYLQAAIHLAEQSGLALNSLCRDYSYPFANMWHQTEQLTAARLVIMQEIMQPSKQSRTKLEEIFPFLDAFSDKARKKGMVEMEMGARILIALGHYALGNGDRDLHVLGRAFSLAEAEGYTRVFMEEGRPMAELLRKASSLGMHSAFAGAILVSMEGELKRKHSPTLPGGMLTPQVEPLSRQEIVVLRLIAQGLSNQEIADKLCVALTTVKTHNYNIYSKLGVNKRYQAVRKATELGLI
jgi:LuxR family transcriptional regulator, maltose regulon positive regulatory protein